MLNPQLLLPGLRAQLRNRLRFVLVLLGIVTGSSLCTFIVLVNLATVQSLESSVEGLAGATDIAVTSLGGESFPEQNLDKVLKIEGVTSAVPVIQKPVFALLTNGEQVSLTMLGIDLLNDSSVRGQNDDGGRMVADPLSFMANPESVAITKSFANRHALSLGDKLKLVTAKGAKDFTIAALIDDKGPGKTFDGTLAVVDIEAAKLWFGKSGKIDQINIAVVNRANLQQTLAAVQTAVGESFSVEPPSAQVQSLREIVAPFQKLLGFLGILAFAMAFFLILNTSRLSISERRREIGILRALGMAKLQIFSIILLEYFVIGLAGSALGSFGAWAVASEFIGSIQQGLSSQTQTAIDLHNASLSMQVPCVVMILGAITTLVAVLVPVYTTVQVSPVEIMGSTEAKTSSSTPSPWRALGLIAGLCLLLPLLPIHLGESKFVHLAPLIGALLVAPMLATFLLGKSSWLGRKLETPLLSLAWSYAIANPRKVERSIRGIVIGLMLIFIISAVQSGFTGALARMFINTARPDFYVSSTGDFLSPMSLQPLDDSLQGEIATVPGINGVYGQRIIQLRYANRTLKMSAFDEVPPNTLDTPYSYFEVVDRPVAEAGRDLYHGDPMSIMVSESFASLFNKKTGDSVELGVLDHNLKFKIVGVVRDFTAGGGRIYISRSRYKALWHDTLVTGIAIVLNKGEDLQTVRGRVEERFGKSRGLMVTVDRGIKKDVEAILSRSFVTFDVIELVCILVASLGFLSSFFIEIQNRASELAAIRIVGCSRSELSQFLIIEAGLLGLSASLVTLMLAPLVAWRLISKTMPELLGWVVEFHFEPGLFILTLLLGTGLACVASVYAIRWARSFDIAEAIQNE